MRTQDTNLGNSAAGPRRTDPSMSQRVLIINGNSDVLEMLEEIGSVEAVEVTESAGAAFDDAAVAAARQHRGVDVGKDDAAGGADPARKLN